MDEPAAPAISEEDRYRLAVEAAPNAIVMIADTGVITLVNAETEKLFGYERAELVGQSIELLVPERFRSRHPGYRLGFFADPQKRAMGAGRELFGRRKDGSEFPVEIGLNPLRTDAGTFVLAAIVDITERKRAEERFRRAVESAPNAMVMVNREGCIVLVNAQAEKVFGYPRHELIGASIEQLVPERFRSRHPAYRGTFFHRPQSRAMGAGRDLFGLRKDGTEVPIEIGLNPIKTEEGEFVLAAIVDITDRKQLQKEREELIRRLEDGVRQRDQFLAILGHELRNPLAAISYATEILERVGGGNAVESKQRAVIARKVQHVTRLVDDLLDVVRVTTGRIVLQREQLDVRESARMVCDAQRDAAKQRNVQLVFAAPDEPLVVLGDAIRIDQILTNLVTNAIKYNRPGGRVDVAVVRDGDEALVSVRDDGIGIAPEMLQPLFEMFVQADSSLARSQGGLGIGLTLARNLAELHGGKLTATSAGVGRGSEFSLRLPLHGAEIRGPAEATEDARARVLLIEDDEDLRTALEFLLQTAGFATDSAGDGAEGLELALQIKPAVAVVDIGLPKIDGYEVCKRLRAELGDTIRLIAMTGYGTAEDRRRALQHGFDAHLAKPVDLATLERLLASLLGR